MNSDQRRALIAAAITARLSAHAPYSRFHVGAAVLCDDGRIFAGCNVENASYGLTICAERVAMCSAVAHGQRRFTAIAVAIAGRGVPCGACRQFMAEFCADDLPVLLVDAADPANVQELTLAELLPLPFRFANS